MEKEENGKVKVENKLEAKNRGKDEDCSEINLIEFSQKLSISASSDAGEDEDVVVLATKGPVALRDVPHPRHLCANFAFDTTPHEKYCSKCYCVSCEVVAPCSDWEGSDAHCNIIFKKSKGKLETAAPRERKLLY